jgi:hypothetical protein
MPIFFVDFIDLSPIVPCYYIFDIQIYKSFTIIFARSDWKVGGLGKKQSDLILIMKCDEQIILICNVLNQFDKL